MNFGKIIGESADDYHRTDALSHSKFKDFMKHGGAYYHRKHIAKTLPKEEDSRALVVGQAAHTLILEGEQEYDKRFYVIPDGVGNRSLSDKAIRAQLAAVNDGKQALDADEDITNRRMKKEVDAHPLASRIVAETQHEVTFRAQAEHFVVQARFDMITESCSKELADLLAANKESGTDLCIRAGSPFGGDVKTTRSLEVFEHQFDSLLYFTQTAFYLGLLTEHFDWSLDDFLFIACESAEPFHVGVYAVDAATIAAGAREVVANVKKLVKCFETGVWPSSNLKLQPLGLKDWRLRQIAGETENDTVVYDT